MPKATPLYNLHVQQGALMVDFAGWQMPLHYGSQILEHNQVRQDAGMFDVSHMGVVDVVGRDTQPFLRYVLANNIDKLKQPGQALYTCMLNEDGGVIDDLIVYFINSEFYRLIVNAATTEKDLDWFKKQAADFEVDILHQLQYALIAVQGPRARDKAGQVLSKYQDKIMALKPWHFFIEAGDPIVLIARTGYTGEDGLELILPNQTAEDYWQALEAAGVLPIGLGARDTLRLEAGLNLYGQDMNEEVTPLESNLAWTVAFEPKDRDFLGRVALERQQQIGFKKKLTGLILQDKGVLRHDQRVFKDGVCVGRITSGTFSPTFKQSIALARLDKEVIDDCQVEIRNRLLKAQMVQPPFLRRTKT